MLYSLNTEELLNNQLKRTLKMLISNAYRLILNGGQTIPIQCLSFQLLVYYILT